MAREKPRSRGRCAAWSRARALQFPCPRLCRRLLLLPLLPRRHPTLMFLFCLIRPRLSGHLRRRRGERTQCASGKPCSQTAAPTDPAFHQRVRWEYEARLTCSGKPARRASAHRQRLQPQRSTQPVRLLDAHAQLPILLLDDGLVARLAVPVRHGFRAPDAAPGPALAGLCAAPCVRTAGGRTWTA